MQKIPAERHEQVNAEARPRIALRQSRFRDEEPSAPAIVRCLTRAIELRDVETGEHMERVGRVCAVLSETLGWSDKRRQLIGLAAQLHDVGKVSIPDAIFHKADPLTSAERKIVEAHTEVGRAILAGIGGPLLELAATIAWTHHERFDGSGYPRCLAGEAIPLAGRIAAVADVFDALLSERLYRVAYSLDETLAFMRAGSGTHFDPLVVDALLVSLDELATIRERFADESAEQFFPSGIVAATMPMAFVDSDSSLALAAALS